MRLKNVPGAKETLESSEYVITDPNSPDFLSEKNINNLPVFLEIGMGKGDFLIESALKRADVFFIGIEKFSSVLVRASQKADALPSPLQNILFLRFDAEALCDIFPGESIDKIFLNFSDPWPKARHAKRRLTSPHFLEKYKKILKPNATIEFKTDNTELFDFSLESAGESGFEILTQTKDLHSSPLSHENIMTEYEKKFSAKGSKICKMIIKSKN